MDPSSLMGGGGGGSDKATSASSAASSAIQFGAFNDDGSISPLGMMVIGAGVIGFFVIVAALALTLGKKG